MAVDAVDLEGPGSATCRLVLRRWVRPGWEQDEPGATPAREAAVLGALATTDVPAPRLVAVDTDGTAAGVPALLMSHLVGRRPSLVDEARPSSIAEMADALARIHAVGAPLLALVEPFRPYYELAQARVPPSSARPFLWRAALAVAADGPVLAAERFLHRDYHPGNTIWRKSGLAGVVDWASASRGPVAVDLAHWRANLGSRHGVGVADRVLSAYRAATGAVPDDQPWWDLRVLLDFLDVPAAVKGAELECLEVYLAALLARS